MRDWRTMESAPQDGTPVWLIDLDALKPRVVLGQWKKQAFSRVYAWHIIERGSHRAQMPNPTHWREIEPPTDIPVSGIIYV